MTLTLRDALEAANVSQNKLGGCLGICRTQAMRLMRGKYPKRVGKTEIQRRIMALLNSRGITADITWPDEGGYKPAHFSVQQTGQEIEFMSLDRTVLQHFNLRTNPFQNDVNDDEDVLRFRGYDQVEQAIRETIDQRGFLAVIAESGSGKTTIWDGIESEYAGRADTVICRPYIKAKDTMTPDHIARCLIYGLAGEAVTIPNNSEDRGRQLSALLRGVRDSGGVDRKAVLYIDDAHFVSPSVLRQLKTFFEEKVGRFRLLGIILVGLPILKHKLAEFGEIGNRIRIVEVPPVPVEEYLAFKLSRAGSGADRLFSPDGLAAFVERFRPAARRAALGRPLIINATCIRAMCRLVANGAAAGEKITREIIDQLPGDGAPRRLSGVAA